jgi:lipid-binding SYLF domain-containing protein
MIKPRMSRRAFIAISLGAGAAAVSSCTTTTPSAEGAGAGREVNQTKRAQIDAAVNDAIARLSQQEPGSRELMQRAQGVLVFPSVFKAGFVVGGEYGEGALRVGGRTVDYYSATAGSFGLQAGAQEKAIYLLFMTQPALAQFRSSSGWQAGVDASVAVVRVGASGSVTTETAQQPIIGYVMTAGGLMVDVSLAGTKISRLAV